MYIWTIALYDSETWTTTQKDREQLVAFKMAIKEEVFRIVKKGEAYWKQLRTADEGCLGV